MPEPEMPFGGYNLMTRSVSKREFSQGVGVDLQSDVEHPNTVDDTEIIFDEGTVRYVHTPSSVFFGYG